LDILQEYGEGCKITIIWLAGRESAILIFYED